MTPLGSFTALDEITVDIHGLDPVIVFTNQILFLGR